MHMSRLQQLLAGILLLMANHSTAQTSREYAVMGRSTWSGFTCSVLAAQMKDAKEQERLFMFGYKQGQAFLAAIQSKKVDGKDISEEVPIGVTFLLQGPTAEFILGRIFEASQDEALKNVLKTAGQLNSVEVKMMLAQSEYSKQNCRLIGSAK